MNLKAATTYLDGFRFPICASEDAFHIQISVEARITDERIALGKGTATWNNLSYCRCNACEHAGCVGNFFTALEGSNE